jgi:hypothetical protein
MRLGFTGSWSKAGFCPRESDGEPSDQDRRPRSLGVSQQMDGLNTAQAGGELGLLHWLNHEILGLGPMLAYQEQLGVMGQMWPRWEANAGRIGGLVVGCWAKSPSARGELGRVDRKHNHYTVS